MSKKSTAWETWKLATGAAAAAVFSVLATLAVAYLVSPPTVTEAKVQALIDRQAVAETHRNRDHIEELREVVQGIDKRTVRIEALLERLTANRGNDGDVDD